MDKREYFIYVRGKAVPVSEEVYKAYWKITEHEKIPSEKRLEKQCNTIFNTGL